jgi:hypothetical protein
VGHHLSPGAENQQNLFSREFDDRDAVSTLAESRWAFHRKTGHLIQERTKTQFEAPYRCAVTGVHTWTCLDRGTAGCPTRFPHQRSSYPFQSCFPAPPREDATRTSGRESAAHRARAARARRGGTRRRPRPTSPGGGGRRRRARAARFNLGSIPGGGLPSTRPRDRARASLARTRNGATPPHLLAPPVLLLSMLQHLPISLFTLPRAARRTVAHATNAAAAAAVLLTRPAARHRG